KVLRTFSYTIQQMLIMSGIAVAADGKTVYLGGGDNTMGSVAQVDLVTGKFLRTVKFPGYGDHLVLDARERYVVTSVSSSTTSNLEVVDLQPGPGYFTARAIPTGYDILGPVVLNADGSAALGPELGNGGFASYDLTTGMRVWWVSSPNPVLCAGAR